MKLIPNPDLKKMTTLRVGGRGLVEVVLTCDKDFDLLPSVIEKEGGIPYTIGKGSNILPDEGIIPVVLIRVDFENKIEFLYENENDIILRAGASVPLARLIRFCMKNGLSGIESFAGIPGTVGGAVAMNAGAFGREIKDVIRRVTLWGERSGFMNFYKESLCFGYRTFSPKVYDEYWCVLNVDFCLKKDFPIRIKDRVRKTYFKKKSSQPILNHTCGCVFKNPSCDVSAGYLLDKCGLKGFRIGDMSFSEKHANFLINLGKGTAKEAWELIDIARERVKTEMDIDLELEVKPLRKNMV